MNETYTQADLDRIVKAAVDYASQAAAQEARAVALQDALNKVSCCDRVSEVGPAIRALMSDTAAAFTREEAPERVWILRDMRGGVHIFYERGDAPEETRDDVPYIREDVADARVTAALREAARMVDCACDHRAAVLKEANENSAARWQACGRDPCGALDARAILAIIPDAGASFDRAIADAVRVEREACVATAQNVADKAATNADYLAICNAIAAIRARTEGKEAPRLDAITCSAFDDGWSAEKTFGSFPRHGARAEGEG